MKISKEILALSDTLDHMDLIDIEMVPQLMMV